jgi:hypothetical protein
MSEIMNLQNEAKAGVLELYILFQEGLKYLRKENMKQNKAADWLGVIEDVVADDLQRLICDIVFPDNEKDLKQFKRIVDRRKRVLQRRIDKKDYDEICDALFSLEDYFSEELGRHNFVEHDNSEFIEILRSIPEEAWDEMDEED